MTVKKSWLASPTEMQAVVVEPRVWIVEGLLGLRRRRPSIMAGRPHVGKSTLARQLAVSVAKGQSFLGRACVQGQVVLWQTEEHRDDVKESLDNLGYDKAKHAGIWTFTGTPQENTFQNLYDTIKDNPAINLVIIEPIDGLLKMDQSNCNSGARVSFERFYSNVILEHYQRVAFLGLGQGKKHESSDPAANILGATEICAQTDTIVHLRKRHATGQRLIMVETRRGVDIPWTLLDYEPKTEVATLGVPLSQEFKLHAEQTSQRVWDDILTYVLAHPDTRKDEFLSKVPGNTDQKRKMWSQLVLKGMLQKKGSGKKNDPELWSAAKVPTALTEQLGEDVVVPEWVGDAR